MPISVSWLGWMTKASDVVNRHAAFEQSALVLGELFGERELSGEERVSAAYCREALRRELARNDLRPFLEHLQREENARSLATVERLFRVISANTFTAVVNLHLIERLKNFESVPFRELQKSAREGEAVAIAPQRVSLLLP
jgi:hypothetical protein